MLLVFGLLDPKRPDGMFIVYPKVDESPDVLPNLLKSIVAEMFFHKSKTPVTWTTSALPAHQGVDDESGTLYTASNEKMEIQLAAYTRMFGETKILYGYYAMRHKSGKKDDAAFLDSTGKGVEAFDKFWQSIRSK